MFVSLDLETTGFDPEKDKIIEFGAVKFDLDGNKETLQFLINPGVGIPQIVTHITRIKDQDVQDAPAFGEKIEEIKEFLGDLPIIGHNIQFDTNFLRANQIPLENNDEYDTLELASILLPESRSHSLEVLTQKLNLTHEEKHRALDDAVAAMDLFLVLAEKFQQLPRTLVDQIHQLLPKSDWPLKDFLLTLKPTTEKAHILDQSDQAQPENPLTTDYSSQILKSQNPGLIELSANLPELAKQLIAHVDKKTYIAVPYFEFQYLSDQIGSTAAKIDVPQNYISPSRLEHFLQKDHFENYEIIAALKYTIWLDRTKTGLLSELSVFRQEKNTLALVNADPDFTDISKEPFFQKAIKNDSDHPVLCTHQFIAESDQPIKNLILLDLDKFARTLFSANSSYLSINRILNCLDQLQSTYPKPELIEQIHAKATILFGLIGIVFEKYNDKNLYTPKSQITPEIFQTKEWHDIGQARQNLMELSQQLTEINQDTMPILKKWKKILVDIDQALNSPDLDHNSVWLEKDFEGEIVLRRCITNLSPIFRSILSRLQNYQIIDESLDLDDNGSFIKNLYGLPEDIPITKLNPKKEILVRIARGVPENDREALNFLAHYLPDAISKLKAPIALLFNSKKQLELLTLKLSQALPDKTIISQTTGSLGKLSEKFIANSNNAILLITAQNWKNFPYSNLVSNIFIHKTPFDALGHDLTASLSQPYQNAFMDFHLNKAIFNLKAVINRIDRGTVTILDPRLSTKDYGKQIVDHLTPLFETEFFTIDF